MANSFVFLHIATCLRLNGSTERGSWGSKTVQDSSRFTVAGKTVLFDSFITAGPFSEDPVEKFAFGVAWGS